jgi:hypothetical protein
MRQILHVILSALPIVSLVALPAFGARVSSIQGQTLVNTGSGYSLLTGPVQVEAGASVVVNQGSIGLVTYADGCTIPVTPGQVYTILPVSPCAAKPTTTAAATQPTTGSGFPNFNLPALPAPDFGGGGMGGVTIGAALVGGGAAGALALSKGSGGSDKKPASASP